MFTHTPKQSRFAFNKVNHDLFDGLTDLINNPNRPTSIVIPHVCNNIDIFGGGFAAATAHHFPAVKENYHMLGQSFLRKNPGYCQFVTVKENHKLKTSIIFANMIAQNGTISKHNPRPLNYLSLTKAMVQVGHFIHKNFDKDRQIEIHAPKFGSGLAGGEWSLVSCLIEDIWSEFKVYIYDNKNPKNRS